MCDRLWVVRLLLALGLATCFVACGDDGSGGDGSALATALDGRELVVVAATEAGVERELVEGTEIRVTFDDGQLGASAGCNSMSGRYALDGAVLVVDQLATTEMGCEPPLMDQDAWLAQVLTGRPEVVVDGNGVSLIDGSTTLLLADREAVRPDATLVGTVWVLDTIFEGGGPDGSASSVPGGVRASVTFDPDGTVTIDTGCNSGSGPYEEVPAIDAEGTALQLGDIATTRRACAGEGVATVEDAMLAVFAPGVVVADVDDQRLTLTSDTAALGFRTDS